MVYAADLKSVAARHEGSIPSLGTTQKLAPLSEFLSRGEGSSAPQCP